MSGTIEIADAKVEDAVILTDISKRAFETDVDVGAPEKGGPPGYDSVEEHRAYAATDRFDFLKVLYDGKIIGGVRIFNSRPGEYDISGLFIDPEYHRKGIGSRMFDLLKEKYSDGKKWVLETPEWNIRTKNFYEKLGFEQVGILRWEIGFELCFYELLLDKEYDIGMSKIADLSEGMNEINVVGKILDMSEIREVVSEKDGKTRRVADATLFDESGSIKLVMWDLIRLLNPNESVRIENCSVDSYHGELQLNAGWHSKVIILQE